MKPNSASLIQCLRQMVAPPACADVPDPQLLEHFLTQHSEEAFAALVRRHGPMVLSVCRRVLHHDQDAEDAFQATFLALARKAGSIRKQESVGSWLHGVAYRVSRMCQAKEARRLACQRGMPVPQSADVRDDIHWHELRSLLDEELGKLPEKYQAPLVLCYLEGRTRDEAARQLGVSRAVFRRRLEYGRNRLGRQLARRGVTLSAALSAPLLADAATQAALPPLLAANTVRAGLAAAMGQATGALVSAKVVALAEGGVISVLAKKATLAVALLASLMLSLGGLLAHRAASSRGPTGAPVAPPPPAPPAPSASKEHTIDIAGRVVDPDGKPLAGARLFLRSGDARKKPDAVVRAVTDKVGHFRFIAKPADFDAIGKATFAAAAKDFGPDWLEITTKSNDAFTLQLVQDDVPLKGRVLDLEGKAVANVTVRVLELYRGRDYYTKSIEPATLGAPLQAITGADGRFQLRGLGRERLVYLQIEGDTIERVRCWALTHDGKNLDKPKGLSKRGEPFYPATFDHVAAPTKPIVGTVRDKATGKPLAGITVNMEQWINSAVTDEQGRYRIVGNAKKREYSASAVGKPYFVVRKRNIGDTPGLEPLVVNFELERGIEITGRVFNKATGEPIQADVTYHALADNSHLKSITGPVHGEGNFVDGRTHGKADGSFFVIGLPGPGYLTVLAMQDDFHKPKRPADGERVVPYMNFAPPLVHAWVRINPSEKDAKSLHCDIALEPAQPIPGQVLDPDGKPLGSFFVAGLTGSPMILSNQLDLHKKPTFQVRGFDPGRPRTLIFIHPQRRLGRVVVVRETPRELLQVRLAPLGAVAGRILDAEGRPRAGLQVRVEIIREDDNLLPALTLFEHARWHYHLDSAGKTDASGKFHLDGLIPGLKYTLLIGEGDGKSLARIVIRRENTTVESGNTKDLGDLQSR